MNGNADENARELTSPAATTETAGRTSELIDWLQLTIVVKRFEYQHIRLIWVKVVLVAVLYIPK